MSILPLMAGILALIYACRWGGFVLPTARISPFGERFLRHVPVALFTALVILGLSNDIDRLSSNLIALVIAGGVAGYTRQVGWSVLVGLVSLWLLMRVTGHW